MGTYSDLLFGPSDAGSVDQTQAPVNRPAPIERPGGQSMAPRAAAPRQAAPQPSYSDDMFGTAPAPAQPPQAADAGQPFDGYKPIKDESWGEYFKNNVLGREDPRYKGLPSIERRLVDEKYSPGGNATEADAALGKINQGYPFAVDDQQQLDIARKALGKRFIGAEKDAYGASVIRYLDQGGNEQKAYLNTPGLDREDVGRGIMSAVPYMLTGGLAGIGAKGIGTAAIRQALTAGATSAAGDVAAQAAGSDQGVNLERAGVTASAAGLMQVLAPAVGAFWRKAVTEPGLYSNGALTPKGEAAARAAGLDPAAVTQDLAEAFAKESARTGSTTIGKTVVTKQFDIPISRGQMSKDPGQLLTEKGMRVGAYGQQAKETMQTFDRAQAEKIAAAALGDDTAKLSVGNVINPARPAGGIAPATAGQDIASGLQAAKQAAKSQEKLAWDAVGSLRATPEAKATLPDAISSQIGPLRVDDKLTPKAFAMAEDLDAFISGGTPAAGPAVLKQAPVQDVGDMRKRLLAMYRGAADPQDKAASKAIYDGFNSWIEDSASKALLAGDPASAAAMRTARDVTREMQSIFGQAGAGGAQTPGRKIVQSILDEGTTPETIISKLFTVDPGATPKAGTTEALGLMKQGLNRYLPAEEATAVWNDVRLAAFQKIIQKPTGELHTPLMMAQNIEKFLRQQQTVARSLYQPEEVKLMGQLGLAMREIAWKDPNPSGTGTANLFYGSQWGQAVLRMVMNPNGPAMRIVSGIMNWSGFRNAAGQMAAQRAVNASAPAALPNLGPPGSIMGAHIRPDEQR